MSDYSVLLLYSQDGDWEGLFVNGTLISEGHNIGDGDSKRFWLNIGAKYQITGDDLIIKELNDEDDGTLMDNGSFPPVLDMLNGEY
ncbi:MAG TPA: hypothetical protein DCS09_08565 [Porphyromonadaceae bacterium]|nr:hypothetical protein [Porphyromonadaceae bacterium]